MNHIQTLTTEQTPFESYSVEFYPSVDDYIHIASRVSGSVPAGTMTTYLYYLFLIINAIVFPVFLWFNDYFLAGTAIFLANLGTLIYIMPRVNSDGYRKYFEHLFGKRGKSIAKVELTRAGIRYSSNGGESFCPWDWITETEETADSVFFFHEGNGLAVRKSGFAYHEDEIAFCTFARNRIAENRSKNIEG